MAAFIILEDGRSLYRATVVIDGLISRISEQVSADRPKLRRWLADKSKRPAPFLDLDIRGFSEDDREEFYAAARKASRDRYANIEGDSTEALAMLLKLKESMDHGEPPSDDQVKIEWSVGPIDLDEIWDA